MTAAIVQALAAAAVGQSSVSLELDSKNSVKPHVSVYGNDISDSGKRAEAEFDRLMDKYHPKQAATPTSLDAFTDADLAILGLQRIKP